MTLTLFSGAWEKVINEKTLSKKSRDTVPLKTAPGELQNFKSQILKYLYFSIYI